MNEGNEEILPVRDEEARLLCKLLSDEQTFKDAQEEYQRQRNGHTGIHGMREVIPLRDGRDDVAQMEAEIPKRFYWSRRRKYGRELFTTDAGMKDLRRHHPEFFPKQISGKIMSGYGGKFDPARRVYFAPGTMTFAT